MIQGLLAQHTFYCILDMQTLLQCICNDGPNLMVVPASNYILVFKLIILYRVIMILVAIILKQHVFSCAWPLILHPKIVALGSYASKASQHTKKTQIKYNLKRVQQLRVVYLIDIFIYLYSSTWALNPVDLQSPTVSSGCTFYSFIF